MFNIHEIKVVMAFLIVFQPLTPSMTVDFFCWNAGLTVDIVDADPEGIANAQKSLGLGQEDKARRVR